MKKIYQFFEKNGFQIKHLGQEERLNIAKDGYFKNSKYTIDNYIISFRKYKCIFENKVTGRPQYKLYKCKKNHCILVIDVNSQDEFINLFEKYFK